MVALVCAAAAALALPVGASAIVIGVADQKPLLFADPRFVAMGLHEARVNVGWDVLTSDWQTAQLDDWLAAAKAAGADPLVSFGHSRTPGMRRSLPTRERFLYEFRRIRARYPWVTTFATWNEPNHCGEPTCHRPELVASYYKAIRRECPTCTILASEVLDMPNMAEWVRAFRVRAPEGAGRRQIWGLHNYLDANRLREIGTRALLAATTGAVWFTETGGIVDRRNRSNVAFEQSPAHAATAVRWIFHRLVPLSPRIARVYLYNWNATTGQDTWDSGLIAADGVPRPAFAVLKSEALKLAPLGVVAPPAPLGLAVAAAPVSPAP